MRIDYCVVANGHVTLTAIDLDTVVVRGTRGTKIMNIIVLNEGIAADMYQDVDEKLKPLERTLQRFDRCPGKVATTRNRVLRGRRATDAAKRTQGVQLLRD